MGILWEGLLIIFGAGAVGGLANALMTDNGFIMPRKELSNGVQIMRPGFLVNVFLGGVAACISWGLYGPFSQYRLWPRSDTVTHDEALTLSTMVGALLVGVAGSRWLTSEVDKSLLRMAAVNAAKGKPNPEHAEALAIAAPAEAFRLTERR